MEILMGKSFDALNLKNRLVRIVDLINYEGPLLTLFLNFKNNQSYIFYWVSNDTKFNRWIVYRCTVEMLNKFINKEISHLDLLMADEPFCYSVEIADNLSWNNCLQIDKNNLPKSYLPSKYGLFHSSDCPDFSKLEEFVRAKTLRRRATA